MGISRHLKKGDLKMSLWTRAKLTFADTWWLMGIIAIVSFFPLMDGFQKISLGAVQFALFSWGLLVIRTGTHYESPDLYFDLGVITWVYFSTIIRIGDENILLVKINKKMFLHYFKLDYEIENEEDGDSHSLVLIKRTDGKLVFQRPTSPAPEPTKKPAAKLAQC